MKLTWIFPSDLAQDSHRWAELTILNWFTSLKSLHEKWKLNTKHTQEFTHVLVGQIMKLSLSWECGSFLALMPLECPLFMKSSLQFIATWKFLPSHSSPTNVKPNMKLTKKVNFKFSQYIFRLLQKFYLSANHDEVMSIGSKRQEAMLNFVTRMVQKIQDSL